MRRKVFAESVVPTLFVPSAATVFTPCAGDQIHLINPNNLAGGSWSGVDAFVALGGAVNSDPDGGTIACSIEIITGTPAPFQGATIQSVTASLGVIYAIGGYFKSVVGPPYAWAFIQEFSAFEGFGGIMTLSGDGSVFETASANAIVTCSQIQSVGNGWYQWSLAGKFLIVPTTPRFTIWLNDSGTVGTGQATLGQKIYTYNLGL